MLDNFNRALYVFLAPRSELSGVYLALVVLLAEWAILLGPLLLVLLWVMGKEEDRRASVNASLTILLGVALAAGVSSLMWHPRPFVDGFAPNYLFHAADSSFPSEHATFLFSLGFALLVRQPAIFKYMWTFPMSLALGVGWARVYLGVHFPFDIAGAAVVASVAARIVTTSLGTRLVEYFTKFCEKIYAFVLARLRQLSRV